MKFVIERTKVQYGQIFGVPVYTLGLKECKVDFGAGLYPDWFAAIVNVPADCGSRAITKELESNGADFIFLNHEATGGSKAMLLPHDILVPVYEINEKSNYAFLQEITRKGDGTILTITMPYPKSSKGIATIEFFYTPTNFRSFKYIEEIEKVIELLNNHVQFEPFVVLYSNPRNPASKNCRDQGKYCAPDPDNDGKFTGRDVVDEMLRQKCVYKLGAKEWISYMKGYQQRCLNTITQKCSHSTLSKLLDLKVTNLNKCVTESEVIISGASNIPRENTILEAEMAKLKQSHEMTFPALYVNGQRYEGHVKSNEILIRTCDTFDIKPQVCTEIELEFEGRQISMFWSILIYLYILLLGLLVIAFACIAIAKRAATREVNLQVKKSVAHYYQMKESDTLT